MKDAYGFTKEDYEKLRKLAEERATNKADAAYGHGREVERAIFIQNETAREFRRLTGHD